MNEKHLIDIIENEAYFLDLFRRENVFDIKDMLLIALGYDHTNVNWADILNTNNNYYPARQLHNALSAINNGELQFTYKQKASEPYMGEATYKISKKHFLQWARKNWGGDPRVQKVSKYYDNYKKNSSSNSPALMKPEAQIHDVAKKKQLDLYINHLKTGQDPKKFKCNKAALIKEIMHEQKFAKVTEYNTYKQYFGKKLTINELEAMHKQMKNDI